jgi:hypothetical protein
MTVAKGNCLFLEETIASVLGQTFTDFEWIFIDDGIGEAAKNLLLRYASSDQRIKIFKQVEAGLSPARNQAAAMSIGKYCAVADSDDLLLPNRLEKQVDFLEKHPEISICGSWIKTFGGKYAEVRKPPLDDASIRAFLMFGSPFAHSTVMWRRQDILKTGLRYELDSAEDYDLWVRLSKYIRFANLSEVLVRYRIHPDQHSNFAENSGIFFKNALITWLFQIKALGIDPTEQEINTHQKISLGQLNQEPAFIEKAEAWLLKLRTANENQKLYPEPQFKQLLAIQWYSVCLGTKNVETNLPVKFLSSPLNHDLDTDILQIIKPVLRFFKIVFRLIH